MKLEPGENRFRIMSSPILGYEWWKTTPEGRKPVRCRLDAQIHPDDLEGEPPKHFWAMVVFDHKDSKIKILEITQKSIQRTLRGLTEDEDWGDPKGNKGYDIVITRTGEGMETRYEVKPKPRKELPDGVEQMYKDTYINLEALYDGEDPFDEGEQLAKDVAEAIG
jgi:hypothetical protein